MRESLSEMNSCTPLPMSVVSYANRKHDACIVRSAPLLLVEALHRLSLLRVTLSLVRVWHRHSYRSDMALPCC